MKWLKRLVLLGLAGFILLVAATIISFKSPYESFRGVASDSSVIQILDREGRPLTISYQSRWNKHDVVPLHYIPEMLQQAFITSEDKRFFEHSGVDWLARANAIRSRFEKGHSPRGASTITEQVVRMLHPRPRNFWSKWVEGWEAIALEQKAGKAEIFEFYLNQVPYAANRRGVMQGAKYYFGRDAATLTPKEMLALAVLVRAPSKFDLYKNEVKLDDSIIRLARQLSARGQMEGSVLENLEKYPLSLDTGGAPVNAFHFIDYIRKNSSDYYTQKIHTTLDANIQNRLQELLQTRLNTLAARKVTHAAALVVDHRNNEILAWVSLGQKCAETNHKANACKIDMVTVPRQPGSALKPFLYAAALEKGWNAATIIDDSPYSDTVGYGLHHFRNYSRGHYGNVTLRQALGNSLNIPALHTIRYVGAEGYLKILHKMNITSLTKPAEFYDDGLALGNGEVSLLELVNAYSVLANRGIYRPLKLNMDAPEKAAPKQIYSPEVASLIGNILSDPWARHLEFGKNSVLNLPVQTAVKTGTSTDYRDTWVVGYDSNYIVGIWMGNPNLTPTEGVTGSTGPALTMRAMFNELTAYGKTAPLYLSANLVPKDICINTENEENCSRYTEYFITGRETNTEETPPEPLKILRPAQGLHMAYDPRIPAENQAFEMAVIGTKEGDRVEWIINGEKIEGQTSRKYLWPVRPGKHKVKARIWRGNELLLETKENEFVVR